MASSEARARVWTMPQVAQIAEIIASVAVVATLIFLAAEVRQNTRVTQAAAYERRIEELNEWRAIIVGNPEVAAMWMEDSQSRGESQGPVSDLRLSVLVHMQWAIYENAYFANQRGLLGASEWGRFERQICIRYESDGARWSTGGGTISSRRQLLTEEFATYVEELCR